MVDFGRQVQAKAPDRGLVSKPSPTAGVEEVIKRFVTSLTSRIKIVEERVENMRERIELVEHSSVERHKVSVKAVKEIRDHMRTLRGDVEETKSLIERVAKRLDAFASDEEVKVLKRYVELWQPMNYVTRSEVKSIVRNMLKGEEIEEEEK